MVIHGPAKAGKSTLAATAKPPILLLDVEGGWKFVRQSKAVRAAHDGRLLRMIQWDPLTEPIPTIPEDPEQRWDVAVVTVETWEVASMALSHLQSYPDQHPFVSIVIDSITQIQKKLIENQNPNPVTPMEWSDWGKLLRVMDVNVRAFRDLADSPKQKTLETVIFTAESKSNAGGKQVPAVQGQIVNSLPYIPDILGYLGVTNKTDSQGTPIAGETERFLLVSGHDPGILAGSRVEELLGTHVMSPNIQTIFNNVYPKE